MDVKNNEIKHRRLIFIKLWNLILQKKTKKP